MVGAIPFVDSFAAVFRLVTQRFFRCGRRALRDEPKNGFEGDTSVSEALENMGCDFRQCNFSTLLSLLR